jgi:pyruvate,orthophosphate dikinase
MMSTVLDVGLGKQGVDSLIARSGNPRFGWDCYRRLISSYAEAVDHHDRRHYERVLNETLLSLHLDDSTEMDSKAVRSLAEAYEKKYDNLSGRPFPQEPKVQLLDAVSAVLDSWASPQAEAYRKMTSMHSVRGTAVIIQTMVFGNMGSRSGSGVAFTRNPWTGTAEMVMDFRFGVQGEDVVSGEQEADQALQLKRLLPQVDEELHAIGKRLEANLQDMQDLEFTVQEGELFLLQSRAGKRSPLAAAMIAVDLAEDSVITQQEAWERLKDIDLDALVEHRIVAERPVLAKGTSASLGIVTGNIVLSSEEAIKRSAQEPVILVKHSLNPGDLPGVVTSSGVITAHGNRMAHAIVVARQLNKACIVNVDGLVVDTPHHSILLGGKRFLEGAVISMNSRTGEIFEGAVSIINDRPVGLLDRIGALRNQVLC